MLDPADLARSRAIATTGTIDLDGQGGHGRPLRGPRRHRRPGRGVRRVDNLAEALRVTEAT
jgi:hypothetical protein